MAFLAMVFGVVGFCFVRECQLFRCREMSDDKINNCLPIAAQSSLLFPLRVQLDLLLC